jgi:hypothetical protein
MPKEQAVANSPDVFTPVSKGLDNLFRSLIILQKRLTPLFTNEVAQFDAQQLQEIEDLYHTVSDENGVLSLQLKNSPQMQAKFKFLSTKGLLEDKTGALKDYVPGLVIGGGSGLIVAGLCIEATVEASAAACLAEGVVEGAIMGARILNPWFIVPSVAFMGASWFSSYMTRQLSFTIINVLDLYDKSDKSDDSRLIEAETKLKAEFGEGATGRYKLSRCLRYPSTSNEQFEFINLLLAQIHLKQGLGGCYEEFQQVIKKSTNKDIKGMALVGQLEMLSPTSRWIFYKKDTRGLNKEAMSTAEKAQLFEPKIAELNKSHKELVEFYFNRVWGAYNYLLDAVASGVCLRSPEEFLEQKLAINKMINFQGVTVLRHMGNKGKFAEILLNFIQGVGHVMHDTHNKYMQQVNKDTVSGNRDESTLAKKQFSFCSSLMDGYVSEKGPNTYEIEQDVFTIIRRYIQQYCGAKLDDSEVDRQNTPQPVLFNVGEQRQLHKITHSEAEIIADNALRNDPNPTKSLREAKVTFAKIKHNQG